jgi:putative glutamine amidotransferase
VEPEIAIPEPCSYDREYSGRALPLYISAIKSAGGEPVVIPLSMSPEAIARRITQCSAILLPGSKADVDPQKYGARQHPKTAAADPLRDAADELLLHDAYNMRKPVFGICYGLQSLNVWRTGSLVQDIESPIKHAAPKEAQAHQVRIEPDSLLARALHATSGESTLPVNSSHHQAASTVGDGLVAVAYCPEDGIVEALEGTLPDHYVLAVQWHPERTTDSDAASRLLFQSFVEAAAQWTRPARSGP